MVEHSTPQSPSTVKATAALTPSEAVPARTAAVILAAGASQRMGRPKALLAWHGTTLLEFAVDQARRAGIHDIVLVLGPATQHVALPQVKVAFNANPQTGRSMSIRLGCASVADDVAALLIQSVDQPCPAEVLTALIGESLRAETEVAVPTYAGRRGHPVCFAGSLLPELRAVTEEAEGLRSIVRQHAARLVEVPVDSDWVLWNLNDPAAYAAAVQR